MHEGFCTVSDEKLEGFEAMQSGDTTWCSHSLLSSIQPTLVSVLRGKKIVSATAGVCHSIFIDSMGSVYTCGKGKGLLGHGDTRIRTVPTKVQSLEVIYTTF